MTGSTCLFNLPVPLLVQALIDHVVTQGHWDVLPWYAAVLFGVFAVQAMLAWLTSLVIGRIGQGVVRDLRHLMYEQLQLLGMAYFDRPPNSTVQVFVTIQTFSIVTDLGMTLAITPLLLSRLAVGGYGPGRPLRLLGEIPRDRTSPCCWSL